MRLTVDTAPLAASTAAPLTMAIWPARLTRPLNGMDGWLNLVEAKLAEAKAAGAELLMIPEYACEAWCQWRPAGLSEPETARWMADQATTAVASLQAIADRIGIALLAGTVPVVTAAGLVNRAWFFAPGAPLHWQDKLCPTPGEADPAGMGIAAANQLKLFEWRGLKLAILICLDIEQPLLAHQLMGHDIDLILCPSMTSKLSGYTRVHRCAAARAVELFTAVAVVGAIGSVLEGDNTGGGALYLPSEVAFGMTGDALKSGPFDNASGFDALVLLPPIPIGPLRDGRAGLAEVWPGPKWPEQSINISIQGG